MEEKSNSVKLHIRFDYMPWRTPAYRLQADEIYDLLVWANDIEEGKRMLANELWKYADEYSEHSDECSHDERRKWHRPYVQRALALGADHIGEIFSYIKEKEFREEVTRPHERDLYWWICAQKSNDRFYDILIPLIKSSGLDWGEIPAERVMEFVGQALIVLEEQNRDYWRAREESHWNG